MPLVRDLHPEFGYLGSFHLFSRKLGLILVFIGFGVMAGMSSLAVFMTDEQPDPMKAMALAPPEAMNPQPSSVTTMPTGASVQSEPVHKPADANTGRPACQDGAAADCIVPNPPKVHRPRIVPAANERPALAVVPIGRTDPPAPPPAEAAAPSPEPIAVATSPEPADVSAQPAVAAPAAPPPPTARKQRPRVEHVEHAQRREREYDQPAHRGNYGSPVWAGYARVY